jgi:macrophage erythroblast attacher
MNPASMAELTSTKLNAESHLLLDQPLLRLPFELSRKNFKSAQRQFEHESKAVSSALKATANASLSGRSPTQCLQSLDMMISRMNGLKRKLEKLHEEEKVLHQHSRKRIQHLQHLYQIPSLVDVQYDQWSRVRLNRLMADYLLRVGYTETAKALARDTDIEELVDLDVFVQCHAIEKSLLEGSTQECLAWCIEHKPMMKKTRLEFELRLQQYIELRRNGQLLEARQHAQKHIAPYTDIHGQEVYQASGLLAYPPDTETEPYKVKPGLPQPKQYWIDIIWCFAGHVLIRSLELPLRHLCFNPSRAFLTPRRPTSPHCSVCRSLGIENTLLPLQVCKQQLQRPLADEFRVSDLLHGIKRAGAESAICAPHEESCGK